MRPLRFLGQGAGPTQTYAPSLVPQWCQCTHIPLETLQELLTAQNPKKMSSLGGTSGDKHL